MLKKWVEIKGTGVIGQVVSRFKFAHGFGYGVDVNGEGDIFYVEEKEVRSIHPGLVPNVT
jgi:hypothetical protein